MKEIPLGRSGLVALIDDDDFDLVSQYTWQARCHSHSNVTYAVRRFGANRTKSQYMHSLVTGWRQVDHIDHNGLNNCRGNLREVDHSQNQMNARKREGCSSQFKGVSWYPPGQKWAAAIYLHGKKVHLGRFPDELDAAKAYDAAAAKHFGVFAKLNLASPGEGM